MKQILLFRRKAAWCFAFLFLAACINVYGQESWQPLGPNDSEQSSFDIDNNSMLAISPDNTPYIAYNVGYGTGKVNVKKFNGSDWIAVGSPNFAEGQIESFVITPSGTPFIGLRTSFTNFPVLIMKFDGINWVNVASFQSNYAGEANLYLAPDGTPYLRYKEGGSVTVKKFNGLNWVTIGNVGFLNTSDYTFLDSSFTVAHDGTPYIACSDNNSDGRVTVMKLEGSSWVNVGEPGFSAGVVIMSSLVTAPDGTPYIYYMDDNGANIMKFDGVAWINTAFYPPGGYSEGLIIDSIGKIYLAYYHGDNKVEVSMFNGIYWSTVGTQIPSQGYSYSNTLAIAPNGALYFCFLDTKLNVKKFEGTSWNNLAAPGTPEQSGISAGQASLTSLAVAPNGTPYICYGKPDIYKGTVKKFNGSNWVSVGPVDFAPNFLNEASLAVAPDGTPYLGYQGPDYNKAAVMKFNGTTWIPVGPLGLTAGEARDVTLLIDPNGTPYIAYRDFTNFGKATVMKFNGTNWNIVGNESLSETPNFGVSFAMDTVGIPYISYCDVNTRKITVKKFNGIAWVIIGSAGFSEGGAVSTSLAIDPNGVPYIAYKNGNYSSLKATVMKFNGTNWVVVGTPEFSAGEVEYLSLTIASDGIPYIAFRDGINNDKATVMKFDGTNWLTVGFPGLSGGNVGHVDLAITPDGSRAIIGYSSGAAFAKYFELNDSPCTTPAPPTTEDQTLCTISNPTVASLTAEGTNLKWYSAATGGSPLAADEEVIAGTYYVSQSNGTCESERTAVEVTLASNCITLDGPSCNITTSFSKPLYAVYVPGATQYRFRVQEGSNVQVIERSARYFYVNNIEGYNYDKQYSVTVSYLKDGQWSAYGPACTVSTPTPGLSQLRPEYCGIVVSSFTTAIYASHLPMATGYRFRITEGGNTQVIEKTVAYFRINEITGYTYGKTYTIDVATHINGQWGAYGPACTVTTSQAVTHLADGYCGITTQSLRTVIYAKGVSQATGYRFRINDGAADHVLTRPQRYFMINQIPGYTYNTTYTINVAALINGSWTDYGPACTITTPVVPLTQIVAAQCGSTVSSLASNIRIGSVSRVEGYRLRVTNGQQEQILDRPSASFRLNMLASRAYNVTYTVEVAVLVNGDYSPYGPACTITAVSNTARTDGNDLVSEAKAEESIAEVAIGNISVTSYPNPYTESFTIEMNTLSQERVTVRAFDMNGRLVDDITVSSEEIASQKLGSRYAAGVYNVIVSQGDYMKAFKMVKK